MTSGELTNLRRIYGEICRGYSEATWDGQTIYVAHLTTFDQTDIDLIQSEAMESAVARGIKSEKERLKWLKDKGIWTEKQERELNAQSDYVESLQKTRSKLALKAQIEQVDKQLKEGRIELEKMWIRRYTAIGLTAENVAEQRVQLEYVRASFCVDRALNEPLFTEHEMRELDEEVSEALLSIYRDLNPRFSPQAIRSIAVQSFFINQFYLCGDQLRDFFGVPIVDLTIYQANLLSYGQHYRNIFTHHQIPKEMTDDPDKIEDYITRAKNMKDLTAKADKNPGGFVGYVGASSEDFALMGATDGTKKMSEAADKQYKDGRDAARDMGFTPVDK